MTTTVGYTESNQTQGLPDWYNNLYQNLLTQGQNLLSTPQPYTGQFTAGFTPQQTQAGNMLQSSLGGWNPTYQSGLSALQSGYNQTQQASNYDPNQMQQFLNPYLGGVVNEIARLGNQNLQQNILPQIADQYTSLGQFGSARQGNALSLAAQRAQAEISGQQANALSSAYNNAANNYGQWGQLGVQGGNQMAGIGTQQLSGAQTGQTLNNTDIQSLFGYGAQQQTTNQNDLNARYQDWLRQQEGNATNLSAWGGLFSQGKLPTTTSTTGTTGTFKQGGLVTLGRKKLNRPKLRVNFAAGGQVDDVFGPLLKQESGFNQNAVSSKGAVGIAQILPTTGPEAAKLAGLEFDEEKLRKDPEYNKTLGKAYLQKQLDTFGNMPMALAAYNAGPEAVRRAIEKGGDAWLEHLPVETQKYVPAILNGKVKDPSLDETIDPSQAGNAPGILEPDATMAATQTAGPDYNAEKMRYVTDLLGQRRELVSRIKNSLSPIPEEPLPVRLGRAMLEASAQGPANIGQIIGRTGKSYYDAADNLTEKNRALEQARLKLEESAIPSIGSLATLSKSGPGGGAAITPKVVRTAGGDTYLVTGLDPSQRVLLPAGGYIKDIAEAARKTTDKLIQKDAYPDAASYASAWNAKNQEVRALIEAQYDADGPGGGKAAAASLGAGAAPAQAAPGAAPGAVPRLGAQPAGTFLSPREKAQEEAIGKAQAKIYDDYQQGSIHGRNTLNNISKVEGLLAGIDTGKTVPYSNEALAWLDSFGVPLKDDVVKNIGSKQAADMIMKKMALEGLRDAGEKLMPGAMSDSDRTYLVNTSAQLSNTTEGRQKMFDIMRKLANRNIEVARMARQFKRDNKGLFDQDAFQDKLEEWAAKNQLFPEPALEGAAPSKLDVQALKKKYNLQ